MRWELANDQVRRDTCSRYYKRKGKDPIPIYVPRHQNLEKVLEAFEAHPEFGGRVVSQENGKTYPRISTWLLNDKRPFNVKFERELKGDDGAVQTYKQLNFNWEVATEVVKEHGQDAALSAAFRKQSPSKWLKAFECSGKSGFDLHMCWSNDCKKCDVRKHLQRKRKRRSEFEKKWKVRAPKELMVKWGFYERYVDKGTKREKWVVTLIPWKEFLDKFADFCAKKQTYLHVYKQYMQVSKVKKHCGFCFLGLIMFLFC